MKAWSTDRLHSTMIDLGTCWVCPQSLELEKIPKMLEIPQNALFPVNKLDFSECRLELFENNNEQKGGATDRKNRKILMEPEKVWKFRNKSKLVGFLVEKMACAQGKMRSYLGS